MKVGTKLNERDGRGWRIPRPGTLSRGIYDLILVGKTPKEIAELLNVGAGKVRVLVHRFRSDRARQRRLRRLMKRKNMRSKG